MRVKPESTFIFQLRQSNVIVLVESCWQSSRGFWVKLRMNEGFLFFHPKGKLRPETTAMLVSKQMNNNCKICKLCNCQLRLDFPLSEASDEDMLFVFS